MSYRHCCKIKWESYRWERERERDTHSIVEAECELHFAVCDVLILSENLEVIVNNLVAKFENLLKV